MERVKLRNSKQVDHDCWNEIFKNITTNKFRDKQPNEEEINILFKATYEEYDKTDAEYRKTIKANR